MSVITFTANVICLPVKTNVYINILFFKITHCMLTALWPNS